MHVWYDAFYVGSLKPPACTTNRPLCQVIPYQKGAKRKSSIQRKAMMTPHLLNLPAIWEKWLQKQVIHVIPLFSSFPTQYVFFRFFLRHFPPGVSCLHVSKWPSRPRRVRPVRARRWTPGGRAAASGGNPSPTFVVDLTRLRWMSRTGSDRINGLFHLPKTNSKFTPKNGWLEYFLVSYWESPYFHGASC